MKHIPLDATLADWIEYLNATYAWCGDETGTTNTLTPSLIEAVLLAAGYITKKFAE